MGMSNNKSIRVKEPSLEMQKKIQRARLAIYGQKMRMVKCPYCGHNSIAVFEDTRGHVQAKCKACGRETVFDVLSMRRLRLRFKEK
jgi:transcription elongation factor Elf1